MMFKKLASLFGKKTHCQGVSTNDEMTADLVGYVKWAITYTKRPSQEICIEMLARANQLARKWHFDG